MDLTNLKAKKTKGYTFALVEPETENVLFIFPITPDQLKVKIGNGNKTVTLIDDGEINILKSPSLTEYSFTAIFPQVQYPFAEPWKPVQYYLDILDYLKSDLKYFKLVILRNLPNGRLSFDTTAALVSLEEYEINENAEKGFDIEIDFKFKQYKVYSTKVVTVTTNSDGTISAVATNTTTTSSNLPTVYTIKSRDTLKTISRKFYGDNGSNSTLIYSTNQITLENAAMDNGRLSSSNGYYLYVGTKIIIPKL